MQRKYTARAKSWDLGETEKGNEEVAVLFEITTPDAEFGQITWHGYFTEKTWGRTIESLRYCGWTGTDISDLTGLDTNEVELVIDDEEYQGKLYPRVRWVNRLGGLALKAPLSGDKRKAFAARMRDQIKALDASGGQKSTRPAQGQRPSTQQQQGAWEPPPHTDEDIPF